MNILFLSREYPPNTSGGVSVYIEELSREYARLGHNVYVMTEGQKKETSIEQDKGITIIRLPGVKEKKAEYCRKKIGRFFSRLCYCFLVAGELPKIVKKYSIDIIESTDARAEGFWYYLWHRKPGLVVKLHTSETLVFKLNHEKISLDLRLLKKLEELWLLQADGLVGVTRAMAELSADYYDIDAGSISVIYNPIDTALFRPAAGENDSLNILYVGRLEFRKGVHILLRAIPKILKRIPEVSFTFVGADCGMKNYMLEKIKRIGCEEKICFVEKKDRNDLPGYYQKCSVAVVPSLWENFPYVCLEAMSCGKPLIASRTGGIKELVQDGSDGLLFSPGSADELAEKAAALLLDEEMRLKLGNNARAKIMSRFSADFIAGTTLELYEKIRDKK